MELPLSITRAGTERLTLAGCTKNISSSGVLFTTGTEPGLGGPIEYIITLNDTGTQPVTLRCVGKVLRSEPAATLSPDGGHAFQIAATLERYEFVRDR